MSAVPLPPGKWQIFGLAYSDFDPDIDPDAVGGDFKPFQIRVTDEWLAVVDNWRRRQRKIPSIAGAIRSLVERGLEAESQKKEPPTPELSEILEADTYLKKLYESGEISIHEYKRRALIAALSKRAVLLKAHADAEGRPGLLQSAIRLSKQRLRRSDLQGIPYSIDRGSVPTGGRGDGARRRSDSPSRHAPPNFARERPGLRCINRLAFLHRRHVA